MNDKPLFSVVIPVFNLENYLGEAVDSVLNQNYQNFPNPRLGMDASK